MLRQPTVRDVGEESQEDEDEVFHQDAVTDEVFQGDARTDGEVPHQDVVTNGESFHQDAGTDDEVEVLSSSCCRKSFHRKATASFSARSICSSESSTGLKGGASYGAGSTTLKKPIRRKSKALIEAEDDDEEVQPGGNFSQTLPPPEVDLLVLKSVSTAGSTSQMANNSDVIVPPPCREQMETMIFTNSLHQTCDPAPSNLSASAQEFQPRVQGKSWTSGGMQQLSPPDLLSMSCHEAPSCLPYQYHAPLPQPLFPPVNQPDSLLYYSMQVLINMVYGHNLSPTPPFSRLNRCTAHVWITLMFHC